MQTSRCDHCRKSFGLIVHRYFRMRFCSSECVRAYQERLEQLTRRKIQALQRQEQKVSEAA